MLESFRTYSAYKDSGAAWLEKVPETWSVVRLGGEFSERRTKVSDTDFQPLSVTKRGIVPRLENAAKTNDGDNRKLVKTGDFVINSRSDRKGSSGVSPLDGSVSLINTVLEPRTIDPKYSEYLLKSHSFVEEFYRMGHGIVADLWTTRYDEMSIISIVLPSATEQTAIANFLDDKTEKIDRAIAIKQRQIELLAERKQILIQNAVTRGLDPNVPMKESGVDWIGEIPAHWDVVKLFGICRFVRGNSAFAKDELLNEGEYVALQYGKTYKVNEVDDTYEFYVNEEFYKQSQLVNFGDVIVISTSETIEDLGHSAIYKRDELGLIGGEQILIKPNADALDYYYAYYSSKVFSKALRKYATGIKVFRFNIDDLKTIYTAVPAKEEQRKIVQHLSAQSKKIAQTTSSLETQIQYLKEYRASLINAAVTGKIKVI